MLERSRLYGAEVITKMAKGKEARSGRKAQLLEELLADIRGWCVEAEKLWKSGYKKDVSFVLTSLMSVGEGFLVGVGLPDSKSEIFYFSAEPRKRRLMFFLTKSEMLACAPLFGVDENLAGEVIEDAVTPSSIPLAMFHYSYLWLGGAWKISEAIDGLKTMHFRLLPPSRSKWTITLQPKAAEHQLRYNLQIVMDTQQEGGHAFFCVTSTQEGLQGTSFSKRFRSLKELNFILDSFLRFSSACSL